MVASPQFLIDNYDLVRSFSIWMRDEQHAHVWLEEVIRELGGDPSEFRNHFDKDGSAESKSAVMVCESDEATNGSEFGLLEPIYIDLLGHCRLVIWRHESAIVLHFILDSSAELGQRKKVLVKALSGHANHTDLDINATYAGTFWGNWAKLT